MNQQLSAKLMSYATYASVSAASIIIILKAIVYVMTDSASIFAALTDSLFDVATSLVNLFAIRYSLMPPSEKFRYGFSKAEDLAVFTQSIFFGASGLFVIASAFDKLIHPEPIENTLLGMIVMAISIVITLALIIFQQLVIRRTGSIVIKADYLHYVTDLFTNIAVLISLGVAHFYSLYYLDAILAIIIGLFMAKGAVSLLKRAFNNLMDHEFSHEDREKLIETVFENQQVKNIHDMKTRLAGSRIFAQFHVELDGTMQLSKAHEIADDIQMRVLKRFPHAEIIIHLDPDDIDEPRSHVISRKPDVMPDRGQ